MTTTGLPHSLHIVRTIGFPEAVSVSVVNLCVPWGLSPFDVLVFVLMFVFVFEFEDEEVEEEDVTVTCSAGITKA